MSLFLYLNKPSVQHRISVLSTVHESYIYAQCTTLLKEHYACVYKKPAFEKALVKQMPSEKARCVLSPIAQAEMIIVGTFQ